MAKLQSMSAALVTTYSVWLGLAALLALLTAVLAWRRRDAPGARQLVGFQAAVIVWAGSYALHWASAAPVWQQRWLEISFLGAVLAPYAAWMMTRAVTRPYHPLPVWQWYAASVIPLITILIVLAGDPGGWLFGPAAQRQPHTLLGGGPWFTVALAHGYALILHSFARLLRAWQQASASVRQQVLLILLGFLIPWLGNVLGVLGGRLLPELDLTPALFVVTGGVFLWAIVRTRLFDVVPVARHLLVEQMTDGVLVLDPQLRVLDLNSAARRFLTVTGREPQGQTISSLFPQWPSVAGQLRSETDQQLELTLENGECLDLRVSTLRGRTHAVAGYLCVWRVVTAQRRIEQGLRDANERLSRQLDEIRALEAQLRDLSERDPLTHLHNRRFLQQTLDTRMAAPLTEPPVAEPCSLIICDVDHFKGINDTLGHAGGDEVLLGLARHLTAAFGPPASVCRYGGEEFVIVLPGTPLASAEALAHDLRSGVADLSLLLPARRVTVSVGVATWPQHGRTPDDILRAADHALYRAKAGGRDRVQVAALPC